MHNEKARGIISRHKPIHTVKFSLKSVDLYRFMACRRDILTDKPNPQFDTKHFEQKGTAYTPVFMVTLNLLTNLIPSFTILSSHQNSMNLQVSCIYIETQM